MTVKELKEKLELLIEDGKEDYVVYIEIYNSEYLFAIDDDKKEVYL